MGRAGIGSVVIERRVGRVILIGPNRRTLMFRGGDPHRPEDGTWWFTPGGGVDPGETTEEAARRELVEETGITEFDWGGLIARRRSEFQFMGATIHNDSDLFVVYTEVEAIDPSGWMPLEVETVVEYRWLNAEELKRLAEPVYPALLIDVLEDLCDRMLPDNPWMWD